ncbi:Similar to Ankyrin-3; acc. no. Q12955 [Pyronema omphalodes CBS 100304]|uniref:Similar to Ankyrin-3 acc. no. Q12955 n=1 Tax=Pyronema omphalodes (strain CBS 100304) TaxID=1076935 RepID=U4L8H9_PYROM|nr:Similar to Ankyrin-3; acc. no. Q12955 [Pyronema omphalodes CBS 100304]CCX14973.1 Similar to Ankyrin-3; acc. no. Q12955 [Pyronema omphalodes CBS 100304]
MAFQSDMREVLRNNWEHTILNSIDTDYVFYPPQTQLQLPQQTPSYPKNPDAELPALPNELLLMIGSKLDYKDLNALLRSSKQMFYLFNQELYKATAKDFGNFTLHWACKHNIPTVATRMLELGVSAEMGMPRPPPDPKRIRGLSTNKYCDFNPSTYTLSPLLAAIQAEAIDVVTVLLKHGVAIELKEDEQSTGNANGHGHGHGHHHGVPRDSNGPRNPGCSPLDCAAKKGCVPIVQLLLDLGASFSPPHPQGETPLHTAIAANNLDVARLLLQSGAPVNATSTANKTPLHLATTSEAAALLIEHNADVNHRDMYGLVPLAIALNNKDLAWTQTLLDGGAHPDHKAGDNASPLFQVTGPRPFPQPYPNGTHYNPAPPKETPQQLKAINRSLAELLLKAGCPISATDNNGSTALHKAAENGDELTAELLLQHGAVATSKNRKGLTPLHLAADGGETPMIRLLLERGADVNAANYYRSTPLHRLTSVPKRKLRSIGQPQQFSEAMQVLLDKGADINRRDRIGQTPLMKASYHGYWNFVDIMCKRPEVELGIKDRKGKTAAALSKDSGPEARELGRRTEEELRALMAPQQVHLPQIMGAQGIMPQGIMNQGIMNQGHMAQGMMGGPGSNGYKGTAMGYQGLDMDRSAWGGDAGGWV